MRTIIDTVSGIVIAIMLLGGVQWIYSEVREATLLRIQKGTPSLEKFTQKMTGKKLDF